MNKTKKIILAFAICLVIAATVLVVALIKTGEAKTPANSGGVVYTLQPTVTGTGVQNTDAWVDINSIAGNITTSETATGTDLSSTSLSPSIVVNPIGGGTSLVYVDGNGNVVDPNAVLNNNPTTTKIDNVQALDTTDGNSGEGNLDEYDIDENGIIKAYYGDSDVVIIPVRAQGKAVKGIGAEAFKDSKIVSVTIPDTVTSIGKNAFENCTSLKSVGFGSNKTKLNLGYGAFANCTSLKEITLPACTEIGTLAFDNCLNLTKVIISKGAESMGNYCFANCRSLKQVYIPESVTTIGTQIFNGCSQENMKVFTPLGSDAESYAQNAGFKTAEY